MIVYGDPCFESSLPRELERLRTTLLKREFPDADCLRMALIHAGQIEQGAADAHHPGLSAVEAITDWLAAALVRGKGDALEILRLTADAGRAGELPLRITVPEGPAFYALYPEQYLAAARWWLADHPDAQPVLVVGIRSIGTTLSAVVRAALAEAGHPVRRITVRPEGHPFDRRVEIPEDLVRGAARSLVVDEGPGLSGSSMAAVGAALERAGLSRDQIAFLPGHCGEPGPSAPGWVQDFWSRTRRYVVSPESLLWGDQSLPQALADRTSTLLGAEVEAVEDFGGGLWRHGVPHGAEISAAIPFEAPKWRVRLCDGRAVLWKFAGLAADGSGYSSAEAAFRRGQLLAREGWTPEPLDITLGWVAVPWAEGATLRASDATPEVMTHIGRYVTDACSEALDPAEATSAHERVAHMLYWNTWESLGEEAAQRAAEWSGRLAGQSPAGLPRYGDGRLAPHEWVRLPDGSLLKTDAWGHERDHTCVGPQPFLWDVAGALEEWDPCARGEAALLEAAGVRGFAPDLLRYYRMAYCAFRLGLCAISAERVDGADAALLRDASGRWANRLHTLLYPGAAH